MSGETRDKGTPKGKETGKVVRLYGETLKGVEVTARDEKRSLTQQTNQLVDEALAARRKK